jgi:hypothetical protein
MKEATLHYLFNSKKLGADFLTTKAAKLEVLAFGELNKNAGPDFLNAKIRLEDKIWAGHLEFHIKSSDWNKHKHQFDPAYENVIAHFVLEHDQEVKSGEYTLPVVELKSRIDTAEASVYEKLLQAKSWIPCESQFPAVDKDLVKKQIHDLALERLERKGEECLTVLKTFNGDQKKVLLFLMARAFGGKVNNRPFEQLIQKIDTEMLARLNYDSDKIQALFHGLSGLLPLESEEEYVKSLIKEFNYQKNLFGLKPLSAKEWKFSSMHPSGNPTYRIMQLAELAVIMSVNNSFSKEVFDQLEKSKMHAFWATHYHFNAETKAKKVRFTADLLDRLRINAFAPWLWMKAEISAKHKLKKEGLELIQNTRAEKNSIISKWKSIGATSKTAKDSQGLIELKNEYCSRKKCLFCGVGKSLLYK